MIVDVNLDKIKGDKYLSKLFINAKFNKLNLNCNILQGDFFSDSFHYFPITKKNETFSSLYLRTFSNVEHFYNQKFFENFSNNKNKLKSFDDVFVLGSNAGNNYYSNLLEFLPRIFFSNKKNIKIAIHRNSSNKYRKFIEGILKALNVEFNFVFLDDDFYFPIEQKINVLAT